MSSRSSLFLLLSSAFLWLAAPACGEEAASDDGPNVVINPGSGKSGQGGTSAGGGGAAGGQGGEQGGSFPSAGSGPVGGSSTSGSGGSGGAGAPGGGGSDAGQGGSGTAGGGGSDAGSGGSEAGSGGAPVELPCHPGFSFSPKKQKAGVPFQVTFTDPAPYPWIAMEASGSGNPVVSDQVISGSGPYAWSYTVSGHQEGVLELRFYKDKPPGEAGVLVGTCQRQVEAGSGGTGGAGGTGGSGGTGGTGGSGGSGGTGGSGGSGGGPVGESCSTPIEMVSGTSGTYFVLDFNCPQLELVQSPIHGSPPGQTSYRSTLAKWLTDHNGAKDIAFAFNTNYSQTNADPITGAYVYNSTIYQTVFLTNCVDSGGCPTSCFLEDARYSVGIGGDGKAFELAYNPGYSWPACQAMGCQGCKDHNWNINMPIKWHVGTNNGIIPGGTRWLVSGVDIETGVPSHNGKPDTFSESLGNRNVMARVSGKNKMVVGLLQGASRGPVKSYMTSTFGVGQIVVFDGGGSTKQYIGFQGKTLNIDGTRPVPGILGFKIK